MPFLHCVYTMTATETLRCSLAVAGYLWCRLLLKLRLPMFGFGLIPTNPSLSSLLTPLCLASFISYPHFLVFKTCSFEVHSPHAVVLTLLPWQLLPLACWVLTSSLPVPSFISPRYDLNQLYVISSSLTLSTSNGFSSTCLKSRQICYRKAQASF